MDYMLGSQVGIVVIHTFIYSPYVIPTLGTLNKLLRITGCTYIAERQPTTVVRLVSGHVVGTY